MNNPTLEAIGKNHIDWESNPITQVITHFTKNKGVHPGVNLKNHVSLVTDKNKKLHSKDHTIQPIVGSILTLFKINGCLCGYAINGTLIDGVKELEKSPLLQKMIEKIKKDILKGQ